MEPESHTPGASQRGVSATDGRAYGPARRCDGRAGGKERGGLAGYVSAGNLAQCSAGLENSPAAGLEKILAQLGEGSWASQLAHAPLC